MRNEVLARRQRGAESGGEGDQPLFSRTITLVERSLILKVCSIVSLAARFNNRPFIALTNINTIQIVGSNPGRDGLCNGSGVGATRGWVVAGAKCGDDEADACCVVRSLDRRALSGSHLRPVLRLVCGATEQIERNCAVEMLK